MTVHQLFPDDGLGFAAAASRLEGGVGEVFESVEKVGIADGATDAFGAAKRGKRHLFFCGGEEGGEIGKASANRCCGRDAVILNQSKLCRDTRPSPIGSPFDKASAHRIEGDVAERRRQMFFIHGDTIEAALPEMAGPAQPCMDMAGIGAMNARQCAANTVGIRRNEDEVNMVGHQHPAPDLYAGGATMMS